MDFLRQLQSGFLQVNDIDSMIIESRAMAHKLRLTIRWRIKGFTTTAYLKKDDKIIWQEKYTAQISHHCIYLMYHGVYVELTRRIEAVHTEAKRMQQIEEERMKERKVAGMPTWGERNKVG